MKRVAIGAFLCVAMLIVYAYAMRTYDFTETVSLTITSAGDTALVMKVTPTSVLDSFLYRDTIQPKSGGTKYALQYRTPVKKQRIYFDSVKNSTKYKFSIAMGDSVLDSFTTAGSGMTASTIADSFRLVVNRNAAITDTVDAQDSGTYVLLVSLFASQTMPSDLSFRFKAIDGGTGHVYTRVDSTGLANTVATIVDGLKALGDTLTGFEDSVGISDSTTFFTVYAKQKGLPFVFKGTDTTTDGTGDTSTLVANKTSYSSVTDTIWLGPTSDETWDASSMLFKATFKQRRATADTLGHSGFRDSASIQIYTISAIDGSWFFLDSFVGDTVGNRTMTKRIVKTGMTSGAGSDTLFKGPLAVIVRVVDSTSDTTKTTANQYKFTADYWLK